MKLAVTIYLALHRALDRLDRFGPDPARPGARAGAGEDGQTTAEYALVLLGVAAIALALVSWVSHTNLVSRLFEVVFSALFRKITK